MTLKIVEELSDPRPGIRRRRALVLRPKVLTPALFLLLVGTVAGSNAVRHLTAQDGLSHNTVHDIVQDSQGFLWFATRDGLNRFDGYEFVVFRTDPRDSASLPHNSVTALALDGPDGLWVGTEAGIARFTLNELAFHQIEWSEADVPPITHSLFVDHQDDLWAGTSRGLYRYEAESNRLIRVNPGDAVLSVFESADRELWCLQASGPIICRTEADGARKEAVDAGRGVWFDPRAPSLPMLPSDDDGPDTLPSDLALSAFADTDDDLWLGTNSGLFHWSRAGGKLSRVRLAEGQTPLENWIRSLYLDTSQGLWVGTQGGLFYLPGRPQPFRRHRLTQEPDPPAPVSSIAETSQGGFWVGTYGYGIIRLAPDGKRIEPVPRQSDIWNSRRFSWIWSLVEDRFENLWVLTGGGLFRLDRRGQISLVTLPAPDAVGEVAHNLALAHGALWMLTRTHLWRLDSEPSSHAWDGFQLHPRDQTHPEYEVMAPDPAQPILWLGGERLARFHIGKRLLEIVSLRLEGREIRKPQILDLHFARGALWIGAVAGLFKLDTETGSVVHYTVADGLPGSIVYSIESDSREALWLGTNRGLCRFDPAAETSRRFSSYDFRDGVGSLEFNRNASLTARDGTLWFGGLGGLTFFDPQQVGASTGPPPVVLTQVEHANRERSTRVNPRGLESLTLPYSEYTIRFEYAALAFSNPSKHRYRYRLEPLEQDWVEAGTRRFVQYTNLSAGRYTFRVLGANEVGEWNLKGALLDLTVTPPFWETLWFRLFVLATIAGTGFALHRYRLHRRLELERLRLRIAEDLHDHLSTDLSGIAVATNLVRGKSALDEGDQALLSRVEDIARKSVDSVRDIVWYVNPEHDRLSSLTARMKAVAASLLVGLDWEFEGKGADRIPVPMRLRREILPIYKELLHNIVRHAGANRVWIGLSADRGQLQMSIRDNGIGFSPEQATGGTGLAGLRRRADRIGARLEIQSSEGRGTQVRLRLTIPRTRDSRESVN